MSINKETLLFQLNKAVEKEGLYSCNTSIQFSDWAGYLWKDELEKQRDLVIDCLNKILKGQTDQLEHNPFHTLEVAFVTTALCMRRLIECCLLTDQFVKTNLPIYEVPNSSIPIPREGFKSSTGGNFFENYQMHKRCLNNMKPSHISNKILHTRYLAVLSNSSELPDGLIASSDYQAKNSIFHFTLEEFHLITQSFLDDRIASIQDYLDPETGQTFAKRK